MDEEEEEEEVSSEDDIEEREKQGRGWKGEEKQRAEESAIAHRRQSKYQAKERKKE